MDLLQQLFELRALDFSQLKERFKIEEKHIEKDTRYQKLSGLTRLHHPEVFPGWILLRNDAVVMIYTSDPGIVDKLDGDAIEQQYGEENSLRSRAGKKSNLLVYPDKGFAVSIEKGNVQFIEVFQPTSLENYKKEIYVEPGPFIR